MERTFRPAVLTLMTLALTGFALSLAAHALALLGSPIPFGKAVWSLHIGTFIVWLPTEVVSSRLTPGWARKDFWKVALAGCPNWMRIAVRVIFVYVIVNFILIVAAAAGEPRNQQSKEDGPLFVVRGFSGIWLLLYGMGFAALYSAYRTGWNNLERRCINGHLVPATANSAASAEPFSIRPSPAANKASK